MTKKGIVKNANQWDQVVALIETITWMVKDDVERSDILVEMERLSQKVEDLEYEYR